MLLVVCQLSRDVIGCEDFGLLKVAYKDNN